MAGVEFISHFLICLHLHFLIAKVLTRSMTQHIAAHGRCGGRCFVQTGSNQNFMFGPERVNKECPQRCKIQKCQFFTHHLPRWAGHEGLPEFLLDSYGGRCPNCLFLFGSVAYSSLVAECPVCLEPKAMSQLRCGHHVCWSCWETICLRCRNASASCPLCRAPKW